MKFIGIIKLHKKGGAYEDPKLEWIIYRIKQQYGSNRLLENYFL
jgi:hypothetical protein